ncbi:MAG: response regulator [Deltaproteobacteria bacterium]|nr:response regulator [Deltaproteobacteria bacterium]
MALILSINEEKDSLTLAERLLTREGHQVTSFGKVREAVEWLKDHFPDLVLASGGRHGEKARETVNLLKKAGFIGSRILLLTGPGSLSSIRKAFQREVREVMSATYDHEDLVRMINSIV